MLTLDLLRFTVRGDEVKPVFVTATGGRKYVTAADQMIQTFRRHVGRTVGELSGEIEELFGHLPDYKVYRGFAKLLNEYAVTEPRWTVDTEDLRRAVFSFAAQAGPPVRRADLFYTKSTSDKLAEIAPKVGLPPEELPAILYGDLPQNRVVRDFDASLSARELIGRYNTALAQAMLYRATGMTVEVFDSYRKVLTHIKLARLMYAIAPLRPGYRIVVDGPLSLFRNVERYGVAMARVLPAVLQCRRWSLCAVVNVGAGEKTFRLGPSSGLTSHYRDQPRFDSAYEEAFFRRFSRNKKSKWIIEREAEVVDLGAAVMIPDFKFTHVDGRVAHLEIVGFWTPEYLTRKLEKLRAANLPNMIVAIPKALRCANDEFTGPVIRYKQRLLIKDVLPALEEVSIPEA
jgi:hypothetical protein